MNFRKASASDILDVKKLWEEVFGDSDDYIRRFISHFGIDNGYVCEISSKIVAMAFAIPTCLKSPSLRTKSAIEGVPEGRGRLYQKFKYLYACATHPDYQSQGIMTKLLETIHEDACKENFAGIFLQAANPDLANYYRKLGFEDFFYRKHFFYYNHKEHKDFTKSTMYDRGINPLVSCELCENPLRPLRPKIISPENYCKKRIKKLENHYFANWNVDFFRFLNESGTQFCEYENTIFSFKTSGNNIIVDELLGDAPHEQIADLLFEELPDFNVVHIRSIGNDFCCGQMKWCNPLEPKHKTGWLGFAME